MTAINFTAYTNDASQIETIKAFMKALKIKFEFNNEKPYNAEFVAKIEESKQQYKQGKFTRVSVDKLDAFLGIE
ncbi:MAG: DUF2683 family protein [Bacteroidia bacterium]